MIWTTTTTLQVGGEKTGSEENHSNGKGQCKSGGMHRTDQYKWVVGAAATCVVALNLLSILGPMEEDRRCIRALRMIMSGLDR